MKRGYTMTYTISDKDGNIIKKYNKYGTFKTYESAQSKMSKLFDIFMTRTLSDSELRRTFLKYDKNELSFIDEFDPCRLYPSNVEIHTFKIE